jgi:murein DD-endopeptidase MepM/ murein hydrolase activator NlpD
MTAEKSISHITTWRRTFIAGAGIQSVLPGITAASITNSFPYGNFVIVETPREWLPVAMRHRLDIPEGSSLYLLYAHMQSSPKVILGEHLESCHLIGRVGQSGNSVVAHLHLEARRGPAGASFAMMAAFQPTVTLKEQTNYKLKTLTRACSSI